MENKFKKDWMSLFNVDIGQPHKIELIDDRVTSFKEDMECNNYKNDNPIKKHNKYTKTTGRQFINVSVWMFVAYYIVFFVSYLVDIVGTFRPETEDITKTILIGIAAISLIVSLFIKKSTFIKWLWVFSIPYLLFLIINGYDMNLLAMPIIVVLFSVVSGVMIDNEEINKKYSKQEEDTSNTHEDKKIIIDYRKLYYILGVIIVLSFLYLFALNGRYMKITEHIILDKWSGTVKMYPSKELPYLYNGEEITK